MIKLHFDGYCTRILARWKIRQLNGSISPSTRQSPQFTLWMPEGFHVPKPGGRIEGGVSLGQYRRITR
jgi:hypothetical protein